MITRRRGRGLLGSELKPLDVQVVEAVEALEDFPGPPVEFPADGFDAAGIELDDLFEMEDLQWTLEGDASPPPFEELAGFAVAKDPGQASTASSPERMSSRFKLKNGAKQPSSVSNKNAIAARLNRLKKKEYVSSLERKVSVLSTENGGLRQENCELSKRVEELEDETRYLRAVLANESMLAQLLSRLSGVNGMKLSSSLFQGHDSNEHDYALTRKRVRVEEKETSGGVCLHVDKNHVSLEFCTKCAERAGSALTM